jgi:hypothetical protein
MEVEGWDVAELPAESNPLTEGLLIHALKGTLSGDNHRLITSNQQLEAWQSKSSYYLLLQTVFSDTRLPYDVRLQSIIQIKNGVEKYWRRGAKNIISDDGKQHLRSRLLQSGIQEPDRRLAIIIALVIGKIARLDFPTKWPDLINTLIDTLRQNQESNFHGFMLKRALLVLLNVTKEVSQNRIGPGRGKLKQYASELLYLLGAVYFNSFQVSLIQQTIEDPTHLALLESALEQSLLAVKIIRRLILILDSIRSDETVKEFWGRSLPEFQYVLDIAISNNLTSNQDAPVVQLLHKNLGQLAKLHVHVAKNSATDFVLLQDDTFAVVQMHWRLMSLLGQQCALGAGYPAIVQVTQSVHDFDETTKSLVDKLGHQALMLLRACVKMISMPGRGLRYRTQEEKQQDADAVAKMQQKVFSEGSIVELVHHIVMELFLFQPSDLREWEEEPDEWEKREELGSEDFEFAARPCAEKLLLDLTLHFGSTSIPEILKMLATVTGKHNDYAHKISCPCYFTATNIIHSTWLRFSSSERSRVLCSRTCGCQP